MGPNVRKTDIWAGEKLKWTTEKDRMKDLCSPQHAAFSTSHHSRNILSDLQEQLYLPTVYPRYLPEYQNDI